MGDVIDSTLMHIIDLPIPLPIHQWGLILLKHNYCLPSPFIAPILSTFTLLRHFRHHLLQCAVNESAISKP